MQSGQRVTSLDELQDIDELCVVEGPAPGSPSPMNASSEASLRSGVSIASSSSDAIYKTPENRKLSIHDLRGSGIGGTSASPPGATPEDDEGKYRGRMHPIKKMLKKLFPSIFGAPGGLPVTEDGISRAGSGGSFSSGVSFSRRKKVPGRRSLKSLWLLLFFLFAVVCLIFLQVRE